MTAKRRMIALVVLAWVSLACAALFPGPGGENEETQNASGPASQASGQERTGGFPGCESLPADVPFLPDASAAEQTRGWCGYETYKDYDSALSFYKTQLPAHGWKEFRTTQYEGELGNTTHFYWEKSGRKLSVGISSVLGMGVIVSLYPDHWIDLPCNTTVSLPTPEDVPLVENMIGLCMEEFLPASYAYEYTTLENFETVEQFYRTETLAAGWTLDRENTQDATLELVFEKPGRTATVLAEGKNPAEAALETMRIQIATDEEYGDTNVSIRIYHAP